MQYAHVYKYSARVQIIDRRIQCNVRKMYRGGGSFFDFVLSDIHLA